MAKPELGTKRIDPETGGKFYDLNKDPIVSPFTKKSYPRSYFEGAKVVEEEEAEETETVEVEASPDTVSLQDVAEEENDSDVDGLPDVDDDSDDGDDDDTFLEDEEDDDDVSDIIGGGREDDED
ncbi:TIGR02300 family protein [Jiella avicenniae]|uniref:TIGR02300 family protein n=1 Tax=Jiella avicenniae TaxID=2907202 RepID=A0A9X1P1E5_9HYPH|nr:TIGR02300 family protein [Jiella avicenniae]MCE7029297.1 TIGR02300 family protein [Jiella avicenniae]